MFLLVKIKANPIESALQTSRDSLTRILDSVTMDEGARRLELLNHICDIDFALGETPLLMELWEEAVRQNDINTIDDIVVPMAVRYMRKNMPDSVAIWIERNNMYMPEPRRTENIEYIRLRKDIRNVNEQDQLAEQLVAEQVTMDPVKEPYRAMRILYSLAVIANRGEGATASEQLKSSAEYKSEALQIAESLPLRNAAHFRGQILLGMSMVNVDYARKFYEFNRALLNEPDLRNRPFYSRLRIISSLESLIMTGDEMPRPELDEYYNQLQYLLEQYPQDTPCALDQFKARVNYYYSRSINDPLESLRWSDSLIAILPKYNLPVLYQKNVRMKLLGQLERWEDAFQASVEYLQLKDSVHAAGTDEKLAELQTQYDVNQLRLEKKVKQQQLLFALSGCLLLIILLGAVWYHYKLVRRKNSILCQQLEAASVAQRKAHESRLQQIEKITEEKKEPTLADKLDELMIKERLYTNPEINRDSVAAALGTNRTYLYNCIRDTYGQTFPEYLMNIRLSAAVVLIEENKNNPDMQSVAEAVGYANYNSFYRGFTKRYGVKPSEYLSFIKQKQE